MKPVNFSFQEQRRYKKHILLSDFGEEGQKKLKRGRVLVIGAGGLGAPVLQYLVAAGIGTIGIVDDDIVDESNLQRQVLYQVNDIGKHKSIIAAQKLHNQNPLISITPLNIRFTANNAFQIAANYDVIVDASDNFSTRYLINDVSVLLNIPFVYGSVYQYEGQLSVFNYKNGTSYRCLYPNTKKVKKKESPSETGLLGVLPGIVGSLQANEVLKIIAEFGEVLSGKLLLVNTLNLSFYKIDIVKNPKNFNIETLKNKYHISD